MVSAEFKKLIEFHSLNLIKIIQLVDPDFSIDLLIWRRREQIVNEDQLFDFFEGFVIEIIVIGIAIILGLIFVFLLRS